MEIRFNRTFPSEYLSLRKRSGNPSKSELAATEAMRDSILTVGIYDADTLVSFGRICGDGGIYMIVCDVMVDAAYEGKGLDRVIIKEIDDYINVKRTRDSQIFVLVDKKYERIFRILGFKYFDDDIQSPMKK